jgi:DNA-nicking Smr family endonuclease
VSTIKPKILQSKPSQKRRQWAGIIDTDSEEYHKNLHSAKMELVLKEAEPKFEKIRKELNDLSIKRTKPKIRSQSKIVKRLPLESVDYNIEPVGLGSKAGKWSFKVHVGEVDNLYKTSKRNKNEHFQPKFTLDLHGYSKSQTLAVLDANLPSWINTAMKSDHPFIVPVEIVCGKGGQVLCEVVEEWIKSQKHVANAPKSKF